MSVFVLYTFLSAFIIVQCQEFQHNETGPHKFTAIDNCDAVKKLIRQNRVNASPMPRERHVVLIPPTGYEFNPRTVTVKRCNGFCAGRWSPMPIKTKPMYKIVHIHRENNPLVVKCVSVEVQEHTKCKCMCMQSGEHCKPSQYWDKANCHCQCKNRKLKASRCQIQYGMEWYDDDCSCACTQKIMECRSGKKWDKEMCRCVPE